MMTAIVIVACLLGIAVCTLGVAYFLLYLANTNLNLAYAEICKDLATERRDHHAEHEKLRSLSASAEIQRANLADALAAAQHKQNSFSAALVEANDNIVLLREDGVKQADRTARIVDATAAITLELRGEIDRVARVREILRIHESLLEKHTTNLIALTTVANGTKDGQEIH